MKTTEAWERRLQMRAEGMTAADIAAAENVAPQTIHHGFWKLRRRGHDIPRPSWKGVAVRLTPEARKRIRALSDEFGKPPLQVVNEIIQGAVVDVPDIARNLLDPEA